jgi:hypothetical protein
MNQYDLFVQRVNRFLILNYCINFFPYDLVEETFTKMAGIQRKLKICYYDGDKDTVEFILDGITIKEAILFHKFLSGFCSDVSMHLEDRGIQGYLKEWDFNEHSFVKIFSQVVRNAISANINYLTKPCLFRAKFILESEVVYKNLFPHFMCFFIRMAKTEQGQISISDYAIKNTRVKNRPFELYLTIKDLDVASCIKPKYSKFAHLYTSAQRKLLDGLLLDAYSSPEIFSLEKAKRNFLIICDQLKITMDEKLRNTITSASDDFMHDDKAAIIVLALEDYRYQLASTHAKFQRLSKQGLFPDSIVEEHLAPWIADNEIRSCPWGEINKNHKQQLINNVENSVFSFFKQKAKEQQEAKSISSLKKCSMFLQKTALDVLQVIELNVEIDIPSHLFKHKLHINCVYQTATEMVVVSSFQLSDKKFQKPKEDTVGINGIGKRFPIKHYLINNLDTKVTPITPNVELITNADQIPKHAQVKYFYGREESVMYNRR